MYRVGFAREIITPDPGVPLAGYFTPRPNRGVRDELYVKAMIFDDGTTLGGVVTYDLEQVDRQLVDRILDRLTRAGFGWSGNLLFNATHTHTGPYVGALFGESPRPEYLDFLVDATEAAVRRAYAALLPAELSTASVHDNPAAFNRRYFMRNGKVLTNPGKLNPNIVEPEGPVDDEISLLAIMQEGRLAALLVNIVNHTDTIGDELVSSDWPGRLENHLQSELGYGLAVFTLVGASGNINHFDVRHDRDQTSAREANRIGQVYAGIVMRLLSRLTPIDGEPLRVDRDRIVIRARAITAAERQQAETTVAELGQTANGAPMTSEGLSGGDRSVELFFARELLAYDRDCAGKSNTFPLISLKFGTALALISLPGEPFTEIGLAIKQQSPFRQTMVVSLAMGCCGYVPMPECHARGGYEPMPVCGGGAVPETAPQLIDAATALLQK